MKRRNFLLYSLLFAVGCGGANSLKSSPLPDTLTFAVTDVEGLAGLERDYEPFRGALAEILGVNIEFFPVNGHLGAASALRLGELSIAWAGPSEYVAIKAKSQAVPSITLNRPEYYSTISVRGDSGIQSLQDLKGKTIDMWKIGSNTAHLGGVKLLLDAGLDPKNDVRIIMSEKDDLAVLAEGKADAWSRPIHKYRQILNEAGASEVDYPILAKGENFPGDIFVLSPRLESNAIAEIQSRLLENSHRLMHGIQASEALAGKFKNASFSVARDADYDPIREVYRAIGRGEILE
ncbi:MAG: phosphate/phosphite/phosphonate ABC transporter substrate-binding protein [Spirulina sp.]